MPIPGVWSRRVDPSIIDPMKSDRAGTIESPVSVVNDTGGAAAARGVDTTVPSATCTVVSCGDERRKVTSASAVVGGNSVTPMSSRNFT